MKVLCKYGFFQEIDLDDLKNFLFYTYGDEEINYLGMNRIEHEKSLESRQENMWIGKSDKFAPKYEQILDLIIGDKFQIDYDKYLLFKRDQKINIICENNIS